MNSADSTDRMIVATNCRLSNFPRSLEEFITNCGSTETEVLSLNVVRQAIHLIQDPFASFGERIHKVLQTTQDNTDSQTTISEYCYHADSTLIGNRSVDEHLRDRGVATDFRDLPCRSFWFLYIEWHNMAVAMSERLGIPFYVLYDDDFQKRRNDTIAGLVSFLDRDITLDSENLSQSSQTTMPRHGIMARRYSQLSYALATERCWERLKRYFDESVSSSKKALGRPRYAELRTHTRRRAFFDLLARLRIRDLLGLCHFLIQAHRTQ